MEEFAICVQIIRSGENLKASQNILISMLEKLLSQIDTDEKKHILTEEYGMIMTTELEERIQTMCNLSENIEARAIETERVNAIERMLKAGANILCLMAIQRRNF